MNNVRYLNPEKCCFCDKPFVKPDFGCNPYPFSDTGRCCSWCDTVFVSQVRILMPHDSMTAYKMMASIRRGIVSYKMQQEMIEEFQKKVEA